MVLFIKSKTPSERAEQEAAKVQFLKMKIEEKKLNGNLRAMEEKQKNAELRRLRA